MLIIKKRHEIYATAVIHLRLEYQRLSHTHLLEINLKYTHINSAESLNFRQVKEEVREELLELFKDGHSSSSALYVYQDKLHLEASDEQELIKLLADRSVNPDYDYVTWESQWKSFILCIVTGLMKKEFNIAKNNTFFTCILWPWTTNRPNVIYFLQMILMRKEMPWSHVFQRQFVFYVRFMFYKPFGDGYMIQDIISRRELSELKKLTLKRCVKYTQN
ncbi:hypothetical protein GLOIN_2v1883854 [Rhizophagus clarus]|uniref:Uncharacterized protein n=1 Tax=Rhizophagus clarus TaxID=94130 RepID=A0A8H3MA19_9GLOM|nr:hypothetical protein GLOIN_2v1883854 [Rhizophagus clarus]